MAANTRQPLSSATVQDLAAAIASAINQSGGNGGRKYNPVSNHVNRDGADPETRVAEIRSYKLSQTTNGMLGELRRLQQQTTRSSLELERLMKFGNKTAGDAVSKYDSFEKGQKALVAELRKLIEADDTPNSVKALARNIEKLEDVFAFNDTAKATSELAKALKETRDSNEKYEEVVQALERMKNTLPPGKTLADVDVSLDALNTRLEKFLQNHNGVWDEASRQYTFNDANGNARSDADQEKLKRQLNDLVGKSALGARAAQAADEIATNSHTVAVTANVKSLRKLDTVTHEAGQRLKNWAVRVGSAAYVLDKLAEAAQHLYKMMKDAAATGTQREISGVLGREVRALINGVDVEAVQQSQKEHARQRNAAGRDKYDDRMYAGAGEFWRITGDRTEALKQMANTADIIGKMGVSFNTARDTAKGLFTTFNQLTMASGLTVAEINALNEQMTNTYDYRQMMHGLDEKSRAASLVSLNMMLKENVLRGISIEQTKDMIQAQKDMASPFSPMTRLKNSVMLQQLGAAQGVRVDNAVKLIQSGGAGPYRDKLIKGGMSEQDADIEVRKARDQYIAMGTHNAGKLGEMDAGGFITEKLGEKMPGLKSLFDGTHDAQTAKPQAVVGKAAEDFKKGSEEFVAGVAMMTANWGANFVKSALGGLIIAGTMYGAGKLILSRFGGTQGLMNSLRGGGAGGAGGPGILGGLRNRISGMFGRNGAPGGVRGGTTGTPGTPTSGGWFSKIGQTISNGASSATQAAKNGWHSLVSARPGAAPTGIPQRIPTSSPGMFGGAKTSISNSWASLKSTVTSPRVSGAMSTGGKALGPLAALISVGTLGYHALNNDDKETKVKNVSKDVGSISGSLAGGAAGAALGTAVFPGVGTLIGGIIGAIGGSFGGSAVGGMAGDKINSYARVKTPTPPNARAGQGNATDSSSIDTNSAGKTNNNKTATTADGTPTQVDQTAKLAEAIVTMNTTLVEIRELMKNTSGLLGDNSTKALAMQDKIRKAVKGGAVLGDPMPASQAYT